MGYDPLDEKPMKKREEPSLFDRALARNTDPETSHAAAAKVDVTALQAAYMKALLELGGEATNGEIAKHTGLPLNSISPRSAPLRAKGLIRDSGKRRGGAMAWEAV